MKALTCTLVSSLLYLFNWCEEEEPCSKLPEVIDVGIHFNLVDFSQTHVHCKKKHKVEFWKENCDSGRSSTMSYTYFGCVQKGGICSLKKIDSKSWNIVFEKRDDQFCWRLINEDGLVRTYVSCSGIDMFFNTNRGANDFVITFEL